MFAGLNVLCVDLDLTLRHGSEIWFRKRAGWDIILIRKSLPGI